MERLLSDGKRCLAELTSAYEIAQVIVAEHQACHSVADALRARLHSVSFYVSIRIRALKRCGFAFFACQLKLSSLTLRIYS
jgi:hypothetical protein